MPQTTVAEDLLTGLHPPTHFLATPQHYAQMRGSAAEGVSVPVTKRDATVVHGQEIRLVTIEHVISINLFTMCTSWTMCLVWLNLMVQLSVIWTYLWGKETCLSEEPCSFTLIHVQCAARLTQLLYQIWGRINMRKIHVSTCSAKPCQRACVRVQVYKWGMQTIRSEIKGKGSLKLKTIR